MILGLVSDAHGNREALVVALDVLARHGAEAVLYLGDAVGYLPGGDVIAEVTRRGIPAVLGNHEAMLVGGTVPPDRERIYRLDETRRLLSPAERAAIEGWPERRVRDAPCGRLAMFHGSPDDPVYGYLYPDTELTRHETEPATVFVGATHRPFVRTVGATTYVNVGSCGLPRDRGDLGAACLFDDATGAATILRFDITAATEEALERCGPVAPEVNEVLARRGDYEGELV